MFSRDPPSNCAVEEEKTIHNTSFIQWELMCSLFEFSFFSENMFSLNFISVSGVQSCNYARRLSLLSPFPLFVLSTGNLFPVDNFKTASSSFCRLQLVFFSFISLILSSVGILNKSNHVTEVHNNKKGRKVALTTVDLRSKTPNAYKNVAFQRCAMHTWKCITNRIINNIYLYHLILPWCTFRHFGF